MGWQFCIPGILDLGRWGVDRVDTPPRIQDMEWHHVAVTKAGTTVSFYVDGKVTDVMTYNGVFSFGGPFGIGGQPNPISERYFSFLGSLDEVTIYDRPLTGVKSNGSGLLVLQGNVGRPAVEFVRAGGGRGGPVV